MSFDKVRKSQSIQQDESNTNTYTSEFLTEHLDKTKYEIAFNLLAFLTVIFGLLTITHYNEGIQNFVFMSSAFVIIFSLFVYLYKTKKHIPVYWGLCLVGTIIPALSLFTVHDMPHYPEFVWLMCANILAFFRYREK